MLVQSELRFTFDFLAREGRNVLQATMDVHTLIPEQVGEGVAVITNDSWNLKCWGAECEVTHCSE